MDTLNKQAFFAFSVVGLGILIFLMSSLIFFFYLPNYGRVAVPGTGQLRPGDLVVPPNYESAKLFSISGQVVELDEGELKLKTSFLRVADNGTDYVSVEEEKTVFFNENTTVSVARRLTSGEGMKVEAGTIKDIKVGKFISATFLSGTSLNSEKIEAQSIGVLSE